MTVYLMFLVPSPTEKGLSEVLQVELHRDKTHIQVCTQPGYPPTTQFVLLQEGGASFHPSRLSTIGPSFPLSSGACTFTGQPSEGTLGSKFSLLSC